MNKKLLIVPSLAVVSLLVGCGQNPSSENVAVNSSEISGENSSIISNEISSSSQLAYENPQSYSEQNIQVSTSKDSTKILTVSVDYDWEHGRENWRLSDSINVSLTLDENNVVRDIQLSQQAWHRESQDWQDDFSNSIAWEIIWKNIDSINVSRIWWASNTSNAFNKAIENIKSQIS